MRKKSTLQAAQLIYKPRNNSPLTNLSQQCLSLNSATFVCTRVTVECLASYLLLLSTIYCYTYYLKLNTLLFAEDVSAIKYLIPLFEVTQEMKVIRYLVITE